jgi:hypothetical protein
MKKTPFVRWAVAALALAAAWPAAAYIEALQALKGVVQESHVIARGVVDAVSLEKKVLIVRVVKAVKGKSAYERIRIDMNTGETWHPEAALRHATVGAPVAIFYTKAENSDKAAQSLIYCNRFFMMVNGDDPVWRFSKIELAMNRVYHGTAEELNDLVFKVLSGRTKPPPPTTQLRPWTRETLEALPPPPKEGEKWGEFDAAKAFALKKTFEPDAEGFLQYWLLAGPIPQKAGVAPPQGAPKEGDKVGEHALKAHQAVEYFVDLTAYASEQGREANDAVFYGAAYLFVEQDVADLKLAVGSDDGSTWWLNGEQVAKSEETRGIGKDQNTSKPLALKKGRNVLVMAVTNKGGPASACARFLDRDGKPFRALVNDSSPR